MERIAVLSLDGGGSFAGVLAVALGRLYGDDTPGREIIRSFDLVAANSGGSIVLAALCCNYTPRQVAGFYADAATVRQMYSPRWSEVFKPITPLRLLFPPYSSSGKQKALATLLDRNRQPGEPLPSRIPLVEWPRILGSKVKFLITAYDYDMERGAFFRSDARSPAKSTARHADSSVTLVEAMHASTQGPILYYGEPAEVGGRRYWDGGLAGYNNPVLAAVVEALANFPGRAQDLQVLSLGPGVVMQAPADSSAVPPLAAPPASTGLFAALQKVATATLADPPGAALFHAYAAMGLPIPPDARHTGRLVRLCPFVKPVYDPDTGSWALPSGLSSDAFKRLVRMKSDTMDAADLALIRRMADLWIADSIRNQPVQMDDRLQCRIGDDSFSQAAARWRQMTVPAPRRPAALHAAPDTAALPDPA